MSQTRATIQIPFRVRATFLTVAVAGMIILAGCDRAETPASPTAAAPGTSGTSSTGSAARPASSSTNTPGTPEGAAGTLPSSVVQAPAAASDTASDAKSTDPKAQMTKAEESKGMPEALQGNNHSSPALDVEAKKP